jgi:hypothetical protein
VELMLTIAPPGQLGAEAEKDADEVDLKGVRELGGVELGKRSRPVSLTCVIEGSVETPEPLEGGGDQPLDGVWIGDVRRNGGCPSTGTPDCVGDPGERLLVSGRGNDRRPPLREETRGGGADAAAGAGDDQHLPGEKVVVRHDSVTGSCDRVSSRTVPRRRCGAVMFITTTIATAVRTDYTASDQFEWQLAGITVLQRATKRRLRRDACDVAGDGSLVVCGRIHGSPVHPPTASD